MTFLFLLKAFAIGAGLYFGTGLALISMVVLVVWLLRSHKVLANIFAWLILSSIGVAMCIAIGVSILKGRS